MARTRMTAEERTAALSRTLLLTRDLIPHSAASDEDLVAALGRTTVCIVATGDIAAREDVQSAVTTLLGLVTMMGMRVRLVVSNVAVVRNQPPLRGDCLPDALVDLALDSLCPEIDLASSPEPADVVFVVGDAGITSTGEGSWRLAWTDWSGHIGGAQLSASRVARLSFGAQASSVLAAMEAYKAALRPIVESPFVRAVRQASLPLGPDVPVDRLAIGRLDVISGGAITNAALHALLRVPDLQADIRVYEPERLELSNANRYALSRVSDTNWFKGHVLARLGNGDITIEAEEERFTQETAYNAVIAPLIAVGADHIPTRWAAHGAQPLWLGIGATSHFQAVVSDHLPGEPCGACTHPDDDVSMDPIPTISFISYAAGLMLASKLVRWAAGGRALPDRRIMHLDGMLLDANYSFYENPLRPSARCPNRCSAHAQLTQSASAAHRRLPR